MSSTASGHRVHQAHPLDVLQPWQSLPPSCIVTCSGAWRCMHTDLIGEPNCLVIGVVCEDCKLPCELLNGLGSLRLDVAFITQVSQRSTHYTVHPPYQRMIYTEDPRANQDEPGLGSWIMVGFGKDGYRKDGSHLTIYIHLQTVDHV